MDKYKIEVVFNRPMVRKSGDSKEVATFKAKINGIPITGSLRFSWAYANPLDYTKDLYKTRYSLYTNNRQLTKDPDYKAIRREILHKYRSEFGTYLGLHAQQAIPE